MIDFSTDEYEFAHGKKPRGEGMWAFFFDRRRRPDADPVFFNGKYGDTKRQAIEHAKKNGFRSVSVGS